MNRRKRGLRRQFLTALLISFAAGVLVLAITDAASSALLNNFFEKSAYIGRKSAAYMDLFEEYVAENGVAAADSEAVDGWWACGKVKSVTAIIYITRDGETLYDSLRSLWQNSVDPASGLVSAAPSEQSGYAGEDYSDNSWFFKREVEFSDGAATVSLYGYFDQWVYDVTLICELALSAFALCAVFICLIRKKINYVIRLEEEVKVLETGGLDFPITVKGNDELTSLADSLNQMRLALSENIQTEAAAVKSNYDLVVSVSHDLRTPLTSLALYLDLIHAGKYKNEEQLQSYLEKSRGKVAQIKQMTDQLFERFYLEKENVKALEKPEDARAVFEDSLSNMVGYLGENGFETETDVAWPERKVSVSSDYVSRIFDNISSNILKYADPGFPVALGISGDGEYLQIRFSNHIRLLEEKPDSTEVGVENIRFMMEKMNGECSISQDGGIYGILLRFRLGAPARADESRKESI